MPAGPEMLAEGAQTQGRIAATVTIAHAPNDARAAEVALRGVLGGAAPLVDDGASLLRLESRHCVLSTCKPAEDGNRVVVRVLNPTDEDDDVTLHFGLDVTRARPVRLDETPAEHGLTHYGRVVGMHVPAHALRTVRVTFA